MNRVSASLALSAVVVGLSACADSATKTVEPSLQQPVFTQYSEFNDPKHIMKLKDQGLKDAQDAQQEAKDAAKAARRTSGTGIYYHGGPVLRAATNVVAVYWSSSTIYSGGPTPGTFGPGAADGSLVGYFLRNLGGSSYFNINSTYTDGLGNHIANVVNYTGFWANNTNAPSGTQYVSDVAMIAMLQSGFDSGKLTYDASTLYNIFTSGAVNLGGGFGTQYCAYHTHGTVTVGGFARTVLYSAMPYDYAYPGACTSGMAAPNGDPGADSEVNTLGHEIEETTTDGMANAWFDTRGYENADKCAWTWGSLYNNGTGIANIKVGSKDFLVQQNWVNAGSGGCLKAYP